MKDLLALYCPFIFSLHKNDRKIWKRVDRYELRYENIIKSEFYNPNQPIHSIFDWIAIANSGSEQAKDFLEYIDTSAIKVFKQLDKKFHNNLKRITGEIIKSFDIDLLIGENPAYLNYIGELIGLQALTSPDNQKYKLIEIEYKLPNNFSADFYFLDIETSKPLLVDFVSIHNIKPDLLIDSGALKNFLINRFNRKLESKTKNLEENYDKIVFDSLMEIPFKILPILWNEVTDLRYYYEVFKELDKIFSNVLPCYSLVTSINESGNHIFEFKPLTSIYESYEFNN